MRKSASSAAASPAAAVSRPCQSASGAAPARCRVSGSGARSSSPASSRPLGSATSPASSSRKGSPDSAKWKLACPVAPSMRCRSRSAAALPPPSVPPAASVSTTFSPSSAGPNSSRSTRSRSTTTASGGWSSAAGSMLPPPLPCAGRSTRIARAPISRRRRRKASRSTGAMASTASATTTRGPCASASSTLPMRMSKGTRPPMPVMVTRSAGLDRRPPKIWASQALPGAVCSRPKASASASSRPRTAPPATFSTLRNPPILECLSDTDIELDGVVARPALEGGGEVEADGSDQRVIAEADAAAKEQVRAVREAGGIDIAALDEGGDTDGLGDAVAQLEAELQAGGAAQRHFAGAERPGALIAVGEHQAPGAVEALIVPLLQARGEEIEVAPGEAVIGDQRQRLPPADGRVEQVVGGVVAQKKGHAEKGVVLAADQVLLHVGVLEREAGDGGERRQQRPLDAD